MSHYARDTCQLYSPERRAPNLQAWTWRCRESMRLDDGETLIMDSNVRRKTNKIVEAFLAIDPKISFEDLGYVSEWVGQDLEENLLHIPNCAAAKSKRDNLGQTAGQDIKAWFRDSITGGLESR